MAEHAGDVATESITPCDRYKSPTIPQNLLYTLQFSYTPTHLLIMESLNTKSAQKLVKSTSHAAVASIARGVVRSIPPQQSIKNQSLVGLQIFVSQLLYVRVSRSDDQLKERQIEKYKVSQKPLTKENTKPLDIKLHTQQRAVKRAMFNYSVATKLYLIEHQKKQIEKVQKIIEEEEVRMLRKEMIPRAQLMPIFDRPFFPQRSSRPLTVPREPSFRIMSGKCSSCICCSDLYSFHTMNPIE
ncbi:unnamed protein product [Ilex paraguariensis]|uniref:TPX2 C-terminal domain-containing protein n=1 Tax=Ilex paraguariensis TaxID=185542 RepID=A0ABC8SVG4_9AQUA